MCVGKESFNIVLQTNGSYEKDFHDTCTRTSVSQKAFRLVTGTWIIRDNIPSPMLLDIGGAMELSVC